MAPSGSIDLRQLIQLGQILWPRHVAARHECPQTPQALRAGALRRLLDQLISDNWSNWDRFCGHVTSLRDMSVPKPRKRFALAPYGAFWINW